MNAAHLHLLLNHIPVLGVIFGFFLLLAALWRGSEELKRASLVVFLLAALITIPTYLTGEPAEEIVEKLPGVAATFIEQHEESAKIALIGMEILGIVALGGLLFFRHRNAPAWLTGVILLLAMVVGGWMIRTANLGGKIHHPEIRDHSSVGVSPSQSAPEAPLGEEGEEQERDPH